jgi:hypothetical protein
MYILADVDRPSDRNFDSAGETVALRVRSSE